MAFLDTAVINYQMSLITDWYVKPQNSSRIINRYSLHPLSPKPYSTKSFLNSILKLCDPQLHSNHTIQFKQLLNNKLHNK